jgi:hypothetical protein
LDQARDLASIFLDCRCIRFDLSSVVFDDGKKLTERTSAVFEGKATSTILILFEKHKAAGKDIHNMLDKLGTHERGTHNDAMSSATSMHDLWLSRNDLSLLIWSWSPMVHRIRAAFPVFNFRRTCAISLAMRSQLQTTPRKVSGKLTVCESSRSMARHIDKEVNSCDTASISFLASRTLDTNPVT